MAPLVVRVCGPICGVDQSQEHQIHQVSQKTTCEAGPMGNLTCVFDLINRPAAKIPNQMLSPTSWYHFCLRAVRWEPSSAPPTLGACYHSPALPGIQSALPGYDTVPFPWCDTGLALWIGCLMDCSPGSRALSCFPFLSAPSQLLALILCLRLGICLLCAFA